jgi:hypothetical protein
VNDFKTKSANKTTRLKNVNNRTALIRHQYRKTIVLSYHRCVNNTVIKNELHLNIDSNFDH